ncbi:MAG TPA: hypothetical protein VKU01_32505 [Bryobacteraceae bacterium]|nr:hypothetical protein [Bryobacteraceae bacterium]
MPTLGLRLAVRKQILDLIDERRLSEQDDNIGVSIERRILRDEISSLLDTVGDPPNVASVEPRVGTSQRTAKKPHLSGPSMTDARN